MKIRGKISLNQLRGLVIKGAKAAWLPILLAGLFVFQNQAFHLWTGLDHPAPYRLIASAGTGVIIFGPALMFRTSRGRHLYLIVMSAIVAAVFIAQYLFFAFSGSFLQAAVLKYAGYAEDVSGTVRALPKAPLYFFAVGLPVIIIAYLLVDKGREHRLNLKRRLSVLAAVLLTAGTCYGVVISHEIQQRGSTVRLFKNPFDSRDLIKRVGLVNYSILDLRKYLLLPHGITEKEKEFVQNWAAGRQIPPEGNQYFGLAKGKNVIFIQLESFEKFLIGREIDGQEITPNINKFAKDSLYFPQYFFQAGQGRTSDAEFTTANSLYYLEDHTAYFEFANRRYNALPKFLADRGYATAAFHGNNKTFWNRSLMYEAIGYQHFYNKDDFKIPKWVGWGLDDHDFFTQSVDKLQALPKPFYGYFITLTQHTPYDLPAEDKQLQISKDHGFDWLQENYLQNARYVDNAFGRFIEDLKRAGLYDNSLIVVDGDHTGFVTKPEDVNFARYLGYDGGFDKLSFLESTQVPLMIHLPGNSLKGEVPKPASHLDLFPTLANLLGYQAPKGLLGQDILNADRPVVVKRKGSEYIDAIFTDKLIYLSADNNIFDQGQCLMASAESGSRNLESRKSNSHIRDSRFELPVEECKPVYDEQRTVLKISDLAVRGDIIGILSESATAKK